MKGTKNWCRILNDLGDDISVHAKDDYDSFLEQCLKPYGISKENAYRNVGRVQIEVENLPDVNATYLKFYIDGVYSFTVVVRQELIGIDDFRVKSTFSYERIVEKDYTSPQWIPVSKSIPGKNMNVWIAVEHDGVRESKPARFILHAAPHFFYHPGVPVTNEKILAWMPRETIGEED